MYYNTNPNPNPTNPNPNPNPTNPTHPNPNPNHTRINSGELTDKYHDSTAYKVVSSPVQLQSISHTDLAWTSRRLQRANTAGQRNQRCRLISTPAKHALVVS